MVNNGNYGRFCLLLRGRRFATKIKRQRFAIVDWCNRPTVLAESDSLHEMMVMMGAMGLKADRERGIVDCGWSDIEKSEGDCGVRNCRRAWVSCKAIALRED